MILGERVKQVIESHGYSVNKMAKQIGVVNTYMYKIVKMESIDTKYLEKIAKTLDVPVTTFFEKANIPDLLYDNESNYEMELMRDHLIDHNLASKLILKLEEENSRLKAKLDAIMKLLKPALDSKHGYISNEELMKLRMKLLKIEMES